MPELVLKNIFKKYGNTQVLKDINLEIQDGEFCVIVGPSGSGKTTLLNIIAGFIKPDEGMVLVDGYNFNQLLPKERNIGMVFQEPALFSHMSVKENISFGLDIKKFKQEEKIRKTIEIAEKLKIEQLLNKKPEFLSGGEAQRVAIGRALITNPMFYLFDEPLGNLDANLRGEMLSEIKKLHLNLKKTFIYVTHDQEQALSAADEVIIMKDGEVIQKGHPKNIYKDPKSKFVAEFFGIRLMNLIEGNIDYSEKGIVFNNQGLKIYLRNFSFTKKKKVVLGIRPEDIVLDFDGKEDGIGIISALEFLGDKKQLYIDLDEGISITVLTMPDKKYYLGEKIKIKFKEDKVFIFDHDNGGKLYP